MGKLFVSECKKVRWLLVFLLIFMDIAASFVLAAGNVKSLTNYFAPNWNTLYFQAVSFHGMFFLPLFAGIFAAFLCFYEHKNGAWKQLLTLPFPRWKIYLSKFLVLIFLLAIVQIMFLAGYLITGNLIHVEGLIPWKTVLTGIVGGWFACLPLAMLQLGLSTRFKSFGTALLFSISMVIPNIVITGFNSYIGAWFPFAPPYYAMFPQGLNLSPRLEPIPFILILTVTFIIYFITGFRSFVRKDWM
ncbi:ABC transporter permease [Geosporobacter ferrireducens]|uniref:Lantibiotic ABC transporter permease n=1 Tax=Geosporobacter ferrireducens TaxID=1424294 RepID=A0A1D8GP83_9FIRM|nr:ABC transporter permease [Geosporobacter ferrireducens]AOT72604.1 lantibiotic ABC transporter permease [Geosporobacter ferrireducens]MTI55006.1 lantibiotic ABC transporter permease [Geosporobacter ferrireducens]